MKEADLLIPPEVLESRSELDLKRDNWKEFSTARKGSVVFTATLHGRLPRVSEEEHERPALCDLGRQNIPHSSRLKFVQVTVVEVVECELIHRGSHERVHQG